MSRELRPPPVIEDEAFVVTYDHHDAGFTLSLRNGNTFDLGEAPEAERYLKRALPKNDPLWVEVIIARASGFYAVQVVPEDNLILQCDLPETKTIDDVLREFTKKSPRAA